MLTQAEYFSLLSFPLTKKSFYSLKVFRLDAKYKKSFAFWGDRPMNMVMSQMHLCQSKNCIY